MDLEQTRFNLNQCHYDDMEALRSENQNVRSIMKQLNEKNLELLREIDELKKLNVELKKSTEIGQKEDNNQIFDRDDENFDICGVIRILVDMIGKVPVTEPSLFDELLDIIRKYKLIFGESSDDPVRNNRESLLECISEGSNQFTLAWPQFEISEDYFGSYISCLKTQTQIDELTLSRIPKYWDYIIDLIPFLMNLKKLSLQDCILCYSDVKILLRQLSYLKQFRSIMTSNIEVVQSIVNYQEGYRQNYRSGNFPDHISTPTHSVMNTFTKMLNYIPQLESLKIDIGKVTTDFIPSFSQHPNLTKLDITGMSSRQSEIAITQIKFFTRLQVLNLKGNKINRLGLVKFLDMIRYLPDISYMNLDNNELNSNDVNLLIEKYDSLPSIKYIKKIYNSKGTIINDEFSKISEIN